MSETSEQVVARLDSYSQEEHIALLEAARERTNAKRAARQAQARSAAARLRNVETGKREHNP